MVGSDADTRDSGISGTWNRLVQSWCPQCAASLDEDLAKACLTWMNTFGIPAWLFEATGKLQAKSGGWKDEFGEQLDTRHSVHSVVCRRKPLTMTSRM